jgi:hypothetical protein
MVVFDFRRCFTAVAIIALGPLLSQIQAIKTNTPIEIAPVPLQSAPLADLQTIMLPSLNLARRKSSTEQSPRSAKSASKKNAKATSPTSILASPHDEESPGSGSRPKSPCIEILQPVLPSNEPVPELGKSRK